MLDKLYNKYSISYPIFRFTLLLEVVLSVLGFLLYINICAFFFRNKESIHNMLWIFACILSWMVCTSIQEERNVV